MEKPDKIICVGRNYLKHALELGNAIPTEAIYFIKPPSSLIRVDSGAQKIALPKDRGEVHHELELVFRFARGNDGNLTYSHFAFGLDLTLRDLQIQMKKLGQPWEKAKVFENAAILGPWLELTSLKDVMTRPFELHVNGELRQKGQGHDMKWTPDFLSEDLPKWFPVREGDLLFTGTPEGVGPLKPGDLVKVQSLDYQYSFTCS